MIRENVLQFIRQRCEAHNVAPVFEVKPLEASAAAPEIDPTLHVGLEWTVKITVALPIDILTQGSATHVRELIAHAYADLQRELIAESLDAAKAALDVACVSDDVGPEGAD